MGTTTGGGVNRGLAPKLNLIALVGPTASDDITKGYTEGSVWVDNVTNTAYTCVEDSPAAAMWAMQGGAPGAFAPTSSQYALAAADSGLPNSRVLTNSPTITWNFSTPGIIQATGFTLVNWADVGSSVAPNNTVSVSSWRAVSTLSSADAAVEPKGTGAFLLQIPDSAIAGGNKRGQYAIDLQRVRNQAVQVASGDYCVISGGQGNTAIGPYGTIGGGAENYVLGFYATVAGGQANAASSGHACIGGGQSNQSQGDYSTVGGGIRNIATTYCCSVGGGQDNLASGVSSTVGGGVLNTSSGIVAVIAGGYTNTATGDGGVISGGYENTVSGAFGVVPGGRGAHTRGIIGGAAWSGDSGFVAGASGDSQRGDYLLKVQMTGITAARLSTNRLAATAANQIVLPNNSTFVFTGEILARDNATGDCSSWRIEGMINRGASAATTAIIGTPSIGIIDFTAGATSWSLGLSADTTLGCIAITITAAAGVTVRAEAFITTVELVY